MIGEGPVQLAEEDLEPEWQAFEDRRDHQPAHAVGGVGDDLQRLQLVQRDERPTLAA